MWINVVVMLANCVGPGILYPSGFKCFRRTISICSAIAGNANWINVLGKSDGTIKHQHGNVIIQFIETKSFVTDHLSNLPHCVWSFSLTVVSCSVANMNSHIEHVGNSNTENEKKRLILSFLLMFGTETQREKNFTWPGNVMLLECACR